MRSFTEVLIKVFQIYKLLDSKGLLKALNEFIEKGDSSSKDLFVQLSALCENSPRPIVLMIDEADSAWADNFPDISENLYQWSWKLLH